jgi:SM-20-related protein
MQIFDNALPIDLYNRVKNAIVCAPLQYGSKSNSQTDPHGHLSWKPLYDKKDNLGDLTDHFAQNPLTYALRDAWLHLKGKNDLKLIRCYVNGYTYGMDGYVHTDSHRKGEHTAILYVCDTWEADWAGETVELRDGDVVGACLPRPNRLLVLSSDQPHVGRAVSRKCNIMRTVLVFKSRPRRSQEFETLSNWLVQHGSLQIEHQHGSLHDHLVRVFQLLEDRQVAVPCCRAGGLHSIYGTNSFQRQLVSPSPHGRAEVAGAFGQPAENLSYIFSILNRPQTLDSACAQVPIIGHANLELRFNQPFKCDADTIRDLCLIECANLLDQNSLDKWPHLKHLWQHGSVVRDAQPGTDAGGPTTGGAPAEGRLVARRSGA